MWLGRTRKAGHVEQEHSAKVKLHAANQCTLAPNCFLLEGNKGMDQLDTIIYEDVESNGATLGIHSSTL